MSNVNLNIMYKFLATFGGNGKGWEEVADADHNQAITYGEFDKFTMSNQNDIFSQGNEDCDTVDELKDLINAFWNTVDTKRTGYVGKTDIRNKFALDDNEMKNIERNVERYNILSDFINNQTQPSFLSGNYGKIWKEMLEEKLGALLEASNLSGDELKNYLAQEYPRIAQECTAECSKMQYMDQLVRGDLFDKFREYYQYGSDDTLNNLIQSYIEGLTEIKSPEEINNDIKAIINAYLAQAGINVQGGSLYDLEALGYQANVLNDLQKAVLMPKMLNALKNLMGDNYKGYEAKFEEAVQKFLDEMGKNGESFDSIKSMLEDVDSLSEAFNNSSAKQILDALIYYSKLNNTDINEEEGENSGVTITTNKPFSTNPTIGNIDQFTIKTSTKETTTLSLNRPLINFYAKDSFMRAIQNLYGYSIASAIDTNNIESNPIYQGILSEVCSRIESGVWSYPANQEEINTYILAQIFLYHEDLIGEDIIDELSLENLKGIVNGLSTEDTDEETKKQIAIEYCEILERKGYGKIVEKVFGEDFTSKINEDTIAEIQHNITKLDSEARYARDAIKSQTPTAGLPESFGTSNSVSGKLSITTDLDLERVEFSSSTPGVRIDEHGNITVRSNGTKEPMTITITASFDSVQSLPLTIIIQPAQATQQSNGVGSTAGTGETEDVGNTAQTSAIDNSETLKKYSSGWLTTEYDEKDKSAGIQYDGHAKASSAKDSAIGAVEYMVDNIVAGLKTEGFDGAKLDKAGKYTKLFFEDYIDKLEFKKETCTSSVRGDVNGLYGQDIGYQEINKPINYGHSITGFGSDANQDVVLIYSSTSNDYDGGYAIMIKKSLIVDKFKKFYNSL